VSFANDIEILDNRFVNVDSDSVSFEETGGVVRRNYFENAGDDGIDLDGPTGGYYEDNTFQSSGDDGIEARLFDYKGTMRNIHIQGNTINASREDAIQLIDYSGASDYTFHITRNLLLNSVDVGVGIMDGGNTAEDFRGASIPERVNVFNNTFAGNNYGLTGGDELAAVNNIFINHRTLGMKNVDGNSSAAYNLFWSNGVNYTSSNVDTATTVFADPLLSATYAPQEGSPAIDAGTATFTFKGETVLSVPSSEYTGPAPDIGRYEYGLMTTPSPSATPTTESPTASPTAPMTSSDPTPSPPQPSPTGTLTTITKGITAGGDDAEQNEANGSMSLTSSDLELTMDGSAKQAVGMRFAGLTIPWGATITGAYLEFTADETQTDITDLSFHAHAVDNAPTFTSSSFNISGRAKTVASANWSDIDVWTVDVKYRTPNLAPAVQEVVNRPGWTSGNAMAIIVTGTGHRTADAYEGGSSKAPQLIVTYASDQTAGPTSSPTPTETPTPTPSPTPTSGSPTPSPSPTAPVTTNAFPPAADAYVSSAKSSANFGLGTVLSVDGSPAEITYLRFDLGSLSGKTVKSAKLRIRTSGSSKSTQNVKEVADVAWAETGVSYSTRPALGSVITTLTGARSGTFHDVVLTDHVASKAGQVFSLGLDSSGTDGLDFYSREKSTAAYRPQLIVEYE